MVKKHHKCKHDFGFSMSVSHSALLSALSTLITPLVRILLRHGVAYDDFAEVVRTSYVKVADKEFPPPKRRQSLTNIAIVTGIHRHEVKKLLQSNEEEHPVSPQHNRAARVINGWVSNPEFSKAGKPQVLGIATEFKSLVNQHSGDVSARAVLDELLRVGAVEKVGDDAVQLLVPAYVPHESDEDMMQLFGECVSDLISTTAYNLEAGTADRRLQLSVVHDNLPDEVLSNLETVSRDKSLEFIQDLNQFFETQDRDTNPNVKGSGRNRAGIGIYFFRNTIDGE